MCVCMYVCVYMCVCVHVCVCACVCVHAFRCMCVCVGASVHVCVTITYDISHIDTTGIHHHWNSTFVHSILSASSSGCIVVTHRDQRQSYEGE